MTDRNPIRIATRGSALARWQAERVAALLNAPVEYVIVTSEGDRRRDVPIHEIGGIGVFTAAIQDAVLNGDADLAVHSAKDLPARTHEALVLAAVPERADARDALVGARLDELAPGATVATGSVRRRAQLAALRPDLQFIELRGNIETRVERSRAAGAGVVAYAALERLGRIGDAAEVLPTEMMVPQVGQGALAVECRIGDTEMIERCATLNLVDIHAALVAERAYLEVLGGGCSLACGGWARYEDSEFLTMDAFLGSVDGEMAIRVHETAQPGESSTDFGRRVGAAVLEHGGGRLLDATGERA